ncbi:MAG TPA: glycosyltransferase family 2 protein, partial [Tepidisphaeraceae bacterium]|nr:glycosyltransferase family 2 protein [Tepidisphaeraceae bacterium]
MGRTAPGTRDDRRANAHQTEACYSSASPGDSRAADPPLQSPPVLMADPLTISIVTPSFNTGRYLGAAISSVLQQDWPDIEYLVMDGGSSDCTHEVLVGFGEKIRWISEKDNGQSDAINKGFAKTSGDILAWLNADDEYAPNAVRRATEYFQAHPDVALVYGNADYIDARGRQIAPCAHIEPFNYHRLLHYSDYIVQPAAFFRRSAFEAAGGLDASLNWTMDYDLWLKIARNNQVAYLPELLAHYRWLDNNKTATGGRARLDEISRVLASHGAGIPAYVRLEYVNHFLQQAAAGLRQWRIGSAIANMAQAGGKLFGSHR